MNAKKAKALRRLVKNAKNLKPEAFSDNQQEYFENEKKRKSIIVDEVNENGETVLKKVAISQGQLVANPATERGLYLHFKRIAK
jgi:hypothetical protein